METEKLVTIIASLLGGFWILVQIITHAKEKGTRTLLIALVLVAVVGGPVVWYVMSPRPHRSPTAAVGTRTSSTVTAARNPVPPASNSLVPTGSPAVTSVLEDGRAPSPDASTSPSAPAPAVASPDDQVSPSPVNDPSGSPPAQASTSETNTASAQASFNVVIDRNLVGGVSRVLLRCAFSQAGAAATWTGYRITVHVRGKGEATARDHVFDRVLPSPILVAAGSTGSQDVPVDPEIGDLLIAYRKGEAGASVGMRFTGQSSEGQPIQADCANNGAN